MDAHGLCHNQIPGISAVTLRKRATCGVSMNGSPVDEASAPWRQIYERLAQQTAIEVAGQFHALSTDTTTTPPDLAQAFTESFVRSFLAEVGPGSPSSSTKGASSDTLPSRGSPQSRSTGWLARGGSPRKRDNVDGISDDRYTATGQDCITSKQYSTVPETVPILVAEHSDSRPLLQRPPSPLQFSQRASSPRPSPSQLRVTTVLDSVEAETSSSGNGTGSRLSVSVRLRHFWDGLQGLLRLAQRRNTSQAPTECQSDIAVVDQRIGRTNWLRRSTRCDLGDATTCAIRRRGHVRFANAEEVSASGQVRWRKCLLVLMHSENGAQLDFHSRRKASKVKLSCPCSTVLEARQTNSLEMPDNDDTFVLKMTNGVEYIVKTVDQLQMNSWLAAIQECVSTGPNTSVQTFPRHDGRSTDMQSGAEPERPLLHRSPPTTPSEEPPHEFPPPAVPPRAPLAEPQPEPTHFLPMAPLLLDNHTGESEGEDPLASFTWFHGTLSRGKAVQLVLTGGAEWHGLFLVRQSESRRGEYVVTFNCRGQAKHLRLSVGEDHRCRVQHLFFPSVLDMLKYFQREPIPLDASATSPSDSVRLSHYVMRVADASNSRSWTMAPVESTALINSRWSSEGHLHRVEAVNLTLAESTDNTSRSLLLPTSGHRKSFALARFCHLFRRHSFPSPRDGATHRALDNHYLVI
uniref:SH2B adapter protein 2-like isoform X2 n=1 Tax=Myxine glutinosa TaxID=7769 RepID=UPI00358F2A07